MVHLLSEIKIKNFKSIKKETFELTEFTPLVGYNNAGKTNILEAIKWLLRKASLPNTAFNDEAQPVEVEGKISGITQNILGQLASNHEKSINPYLISDSIFIKRIQEKPNSSATGVRLFVKDPQKVNSPDQWVLNPTGLDQAIQALFPEPIFIGAMENSEEDVSKNKTSTTIGKLLAKILQPIQNSHGQQVQSALDGIKELLDIDGAARATELEDFDFEVNQKVQSFFPGVSIKIHVPMPELKDVFSKGTIKVFESLNPNGKDVTALGHGAQRSIQMALVRQLADVKKTTSGHTSNTILLIDEPELYLHPQAIEILRDALEKLSKQGYQVIFSTHSPFLITSKDVGNTLLIRKEPGRGTCKRKSLSSANKTIPSDAKSQLELIFSLSNSSNVLFSERVILAEGKTEKRLLPSIVHKITDKTFGLNKTALVSMGGSGNTRKAMLVLDHMGIPNKAVVDLDFVLTRGEKDKFLEKNDPDVAFIKNHLASIANAKSILLKEGWPTGKKKEAVEGFRILAKEPAIKANLNSLKTKMEAKGIYVWIKGTIEDHLGGIPKNEEGWAEFNKRLDSEDLDKILPNDHQEIRDFVGWLFK